MNHWKFVLATFALLEGCAGVQAKVDDICDVVARADHYAAAALDAVRSDPGASGEARIAVTKVATQVVEAHDICFEEPE